MSARSLLPGDPGDAEQKLRVLVVGAEREALRTIDHVIQEEGDTFEVASDLDDAVESASARHVDLAIVDLDTLGPAAVALCHHLPAVAPAVVVHVIASPRKIEAAEEAMSLGAASVIASPITGASVARVLASVKAAMRHARELNALKSRLAHERKRVEIYDRLVRFARGAGHSDAVRAIVDGVSQMSAAKGVALYATFGDDESERVLLSAVGTLLELPSRSKPADLSRLVQARQARVVPLATGAGAIGLLVIDGGRDTRDSELASVADLAAAMLALLDRQDHIDERVRVFPPRHFRAIAERMLTLASRHGRRASMLAIKLPNPERLMQREEATLEIADIVRNTDALCGTEDGDLLLFLPETGGAGAQTCRRRILARLTGDRRGRPKGSSTRGEPLRRRPAIAVGVATFPHDGTSLPKLLRTARTRAVDDARSPVRLLGLDTMTLPAVVDALIARPMLDAGTRSPYPIDVAAASLFALVGRACREALRGGTAAVLATVQPGLGVAAAARQVTPPRLHDVRGAAGCEDIEAVVIEAEHGAWVCCGRLVGERFRGVHCADQLLADVIANRLESVGAIDDD